MKEKKRTPGSVVLIIVSVFLLCAYNLYDVALQTGNYRGMWFSLLHMAIVAVGTCVALRMPVAEAGELSPGTADLQVP